MTEQTDIRRNGFERFDCAPALRLEAHERVSRLQVEALHDRIARLEVVIERVERRLWLTVYGVSVDTREGDDRQATANIERPIARPG